ncbi:MAG: HDIG domain-containing metalloprotein [Planctomycetota bacterium]
MAAAISISQLSESGPGFSVGQYLHQPEYAEVDFQVADPVRTQMDRDSARAATPSYYTPTPGQMTFERVRADLKRLYQAATDSSSFEAFSATLGEWQWPAEQGAYHRLRSLVDLPENKGAVQFQQWVDQLPLDREYVVQNLSTERRSPPTTTEFIVIESTVGEGNPSVLQVPHSQLVPQGNEKALRGSAADVARKVPSPELRSTVEAIVFKIFREHPTIVFNAERTSEKLREAEEKTAEARTTYEKGKPFVERGVVGSDGFDRLKAHHDAYRRFLEQDLPEARKLARMESLRRLGRAVLVVLLTVGLFVFAASHHARVLEIRSRTVAFSLLTLVTLFISRGLHVLWPDLSEIVLVPCLFTAAVMAIVYPRRFALGAMWVLSLLVTVTINGEFAFLVILCTGVMVLGYQLDQVRSRTKLIVSGALTAMVVMTTSAANGFCQRHAIGYIADHALWSGGSVMMAAFITSGILPFVERLFRIATALTLLEWRDSTRPLLQRLAHDAPGTYNHSLVVGVLAEAACESIGANGLLAQVGALYHDIGKTRKAEYFTENQEGSFSRHDKLAPTMSLLIILGHVRDGLELAREYKLPRALHPFIEEHHGTTVVRYFHTVASERQPRIAVGKHDREISEAEFRYPGPKPRSRETAVLMMCDGVEGAVRSLPEPSVGRMETVVHQIIMDRLHDGQFDDCDITLREIRKVEESLVKSLCGMYHGRLAYPKAGKTGDSSLARQLIGT